MSEFINLSHSYTHAQSQPLGSFRSDRIEPIDPVQHYNPLNKLTKIIATIGPSSSSATAIESLILSGANVFRLNFSHGHHTEKSSIVTTIREFSNKFNFHFPIIADLQGNKFRLGETFDHCPIHLFNGQQILFTSGEIQSKSTNESLVTGTKHSHALLKFLEPNQLLLISDASIVLRVESRFSPHQVSCSVLVGGPCGERKGVNVQGLNVPMPPLTEKDIDDALFALNHRVDAFALSFVQCSDDVGELRNFLERALSEQTNSRNYRPLIIAKIEKPQAVNHLDSIIRAADLVMVERGDLASEMNSTAVPAIQKLSIETCQRLSKPVIIATQMLESMIDNPQPTRAEVSDIFTAVLDGADLTMLSAESAAGKFPIESVRTMRDIEIEAEKFKTKAIPMFPSHCNVVLNVISAALAATIHGANIRSLIIVTNHYDSIVYASKFHLACPIIVLTFDPSLVTKIHFLFGCFGLVIDQLSPSSLPSLPVKDFFTLVECLIGDRGWLNVGDNFVLACPDDLSLVGLNQSVQCGKFGSFGAKR